MGDNVTWDCLAFENQKNFAFWETKKKLTCGRKNPQPDLFPTFSFCNLQAFLLHLGHLNTCLFLMPCQNLARDRPGNCDLNILYIILKYIYFNGDTDVQI